MTRGDLVRPAGRWRRLVKPACALAAVACAVAAASWKAAPSGRAGGQSTADVALVLSGDVDYLRLRRAVALYHTGAVRRILVTGAGYGGDSAVTLAALAERDGVPASVILREDRSTSTRENLVLAAPLLRAHGGRRIALVTSRSHMRRAMRAATRAMPEAEWIAVPVEDAGPLSRVWRTRVSEWVKLAWYVARGWA